MISCPLELKFPPIVAVRQGGYNLTMGSQIVAPIFTRASRQRVGSQGRNGFEINLATDTARIVTDAATGARYIYLDIQTISGASENGFELWAGPPSASAGIPSDANFRNVYISDNPNERQSFGVSVFAMGTLPMNASASGDSLIFPSFMSLPPMQVVKSLSLFLIQTRGRNRPLPSISTQ